MAGLPEGSVTTNENITREIESFDHVDVADFFRLWRAYSTNKSILVDGSGRRLENFFWRILSSEHIWKNITGSQVAIIFSAIDEEGPLRTTPTQSPRVSRVLGRHGGRSSASQKYQQNNQDQVESATPTERKPKTTRHAVKGEDNLYSTGEGHATNRIKKVETSREEYLQTVPSQPDTVSEDDEDERTPTPTPPLTAYGLQTPSQLEAPQRSQLLLKSELLRADSQTLSSGSSTSLTTVTSASSEDTVKGNPSGSKKLPKTTGRKRGVYHASTPARRRPIAMRRKSSQSSSSAASTAISPRPSASSAASPDEIPAVDLGKQSKRNTLTSEEAIEDYESSTTEARGARMEVPGARPNHVGQQSTIVEPDFRSRFVAKTRSAQSSFVSLPSLLRKPSATAATCASYQAAGTLELGQTRLAGKGRGRVKFLDEVQSPETQVLSSSSSTEEVDRALALSRTQSQLTLLLERDRRAGGNEQEQKHQKKPSR